jgi:alcohol dehydrogenase class IV
MTGCPMTGRPTRVLSGPGAVRRLSGVLRRRGVRSCLLVTGGRSYGGSGLASAIEAQLAGVRTVRAPGVRPNPSLDDLTHGLAVLRGAEVDAVIAVGGGSVLDYGKAVTALAAQPWRAPRECLTGSFPMPRRHALVLVPSTSGTGSEVTAIAVFTVDGRKRSLEHETLRADVAIVDPELTYGLPAAVTAATGVDALSQAVESYWSTRSTPGSRRRSLTAITLVWRHLEAATLRGDPVARAGMSRAATLSGHAIDITQTTIPHALSYLLTTRFGVPHGHACGVFLGPVLAYNAGVGTADVADPRGVPFVRGRMRELARRLGAPDPATAAYRLEDLLGRLGLATRLSAFGVTRDDVGALVQAALDSPRLAANPRRLDRAALTDLVAARL